MSEVKNPTVINRLRQFFRREEEPYSDLVRYWPNSIELTKTQRGYTWSIKMRTNPGEQDQTLVDIKGIDDRLKKQYGDGTIGV